jgi:toxin ParE1/3/4
MPVDNYVIYYHVNLEEALVHVVRVVYGGRDVENILNNE